MQEGFKEGQYWDTAMPYHYVRREGNILVVGGEDHHTGVKPKEYEVLTPPSLGKSARLHSQHVPCMSTGKVEDKDHTCNCQFVEKVMWPLR